jgi:Na+/H+ antiporter NhaD/arsenite permease-like protein
MSDGQWLLVTMTTGIGGSLFSVGSASGIVLMGRFNYCYNFFVHLQWSWVILISYFFSVFSHIILNNSIFFLF